MSSSDQNVTAADSWEISGTGEDTGSNDPNRWKNSNHLGHCIMFIHPEQFERVSARPGADGKPASYQVAATSFVVCFDCNHCWKNVDVSGKALVPRLLSATGPIVVVVLEEGEKGQYDNAPIIPMVASAEQEALAREVLTVYAHRMMSGTILFDEAAFNDAAADEKF